MLIRKKHKLKNEFDNKLIEQMEAARKEWLQQSNFLKLSMEQSLDLIARKKIAEAKYFFLYREAKKRKIIIKG